MMSISYSEFLLTLARLREVPTSRRCLDLLTCFYSTGTNHSEIALWDHTYFLSEEIQETGGSRFLAGSEWRTCDLLGSSFLRALLPYQ